MICIILLRSSSVHESVALKSSFSHNYICSLTLLLPLSCPLEFPVEDHPEGRMLPLKACMSIYHSPGRPHLLDLDGVNSTASVPPPTTPGVVRVV
jgi:hypothetical protein